MVFENGIDQTAHLMGIDGENDRLIGVHGGSPIFSPDGEYIAYLKKSDEPGLTWDGMNPYSPQGIALYDITHNTERMITTNKKDGGIIAFSADEAGIYFHSERGDNYSAIYYADINGVDSVRRAEGELMFEKYRVLLAVPDTFFLWEELLKYTYSDGTQWVRILYTNPRDPARPRISFEVNPDGYGPFFPDHIYEIQDGTTTAPILNITDITDDETKNDGTVWYLTVFTAADGNRYSIMYKRGEPTRENTDGPADRAFFESLLSSFRIPEPADKK